MEDREAKTPETGKAVSRRDFLKMAGVAGATIGVAGGLGGVLAACGGTEEATTTTAAATSSTASAETTTSAAGGVELGSTSASRAAVQLHAARAHRTTVEATGSACAGRAAIEETAGPDGTTIASPSARGIAAAHPSPVDTSMAPLSSHHFLHPIGDLFAYPVRVIFLEVVQPCSQLDEAAIVQFGGECFGRSR